MAAAPSLRAEPKRRQRTEKHICPYSWLQNVFCNFILTLFSKLNSTITIKTREGINRPSGLRLTLEWTARCPSVWNGWHLNCRKVSTGPTTTRLLTVGHRIPSCSCLQLMLARLIRRPSPGSHSVRCPSCSKYNSQATIRRSELDRLNLDWTRPDWTGLD